MRQTFKNQAGRCVKRCAALRNARCLVLMVAVVFTATSVFAAETLKGRVVKVSDGDTITVLDAANVQHRIRLDKIDAPEKSQPFGDAARKHLATFVAGKDGEIEWAKKDKYGRILGTVWAMIPVRTDVNLQMVKDGFVWHYSHFDSTPAYAAAEREARTAKRGLWVADDPINPHQWRKSKLSLPGVSATPPVARRSGRETRRSDWETRRANGHPLHDGFTCGLGIAQEYCGIVNCSSSTRP